MADMKKLLHTFDEADEILNDKIERTNLSTIVASATASVENKKTVLIRGTGRNIEVLKVGGKTVQNGTPTPTNPVEVKGVGDKSKNLCPITITSGTKNGINYSVNNDIITIRGTATSGVEVNVNEWTNSSNPLKNGTYTLSGVFTSDGTIVVNQKSGATLAIIDPTKPKVTFEVTDATGIGSIYIYVPRDKTVNGTIQFQLEKGNIATEYIPYGKYKIPILTDGKSQNIYLDAPLFDGEIADLVGGKVEKKYGMVTLNGSENWITGTTQGFTYFGLPKTGTEIANAKNNTVAYSDYQVGVSTANIAENIYVNSGGYLILLTQKLGTAVDAFKTWLSTHNMTVVYELDSAATETFDGAVIPTVSGNNEISIDTAVTPASIDVTTFGDYYSKAEIDRKFAELSDRLSTVETSAHEDDGVVVPEE